MFQSAGDSNWATQMRNLYSQTKSQDAMRRVFDDLPGAEDAEVVDLTGNLPPMPGIWPDYPAPIIRHQAGAVYNCRWRAGA
jgi:hypothetical protein